MSFSVASGVFTQSGTDADLSGLNGLTGVTTTTVGDKTHYALASGNRIVVTGTLNHDPDKEVLIFDAVAIGSSAIMINSGGTYNFGKEHTKNSVVRYSQGLGIINKITLGSTNGFNATYSNSAVIRTNASGALFTWKGGQIMSPTLLTNASSGDFDIYEGTFICSYNSSNTSNPPSIVIKSGSNLNKFRNLKLYSPTTYPGILFQWEKSPDIFDGVTMVHGSGMGTSGATLDVSSGVALPIVVKNYTSLGGDNDLTFWRQNLIRCINFYKGSDVITKGMTSAATATNIGLVEVYKEVAVTTKTLSNSSIQGAKVYCKDYNNGNRQPNYRGYSWTADRVYTWVTDSAGSAPAQNVLLLASIKTSNNAWDVGIQKDYRSKNNDITDMFEFFCVQYNYLLQTVLTSLTGLNTLTVAATLFVDPLVTETSKSVVDAYTDINSVTRLYDAAKSWLYDNFAGQSSTYLSRSGDSANLNGLNLVFINDYSSSATYAVGDYVWQANKIYKCSTAISTAEAFTSSKWTQLSAYAFALDGTTVLLKATSFTGNLTTTGTITNSAGITVNGTLIDSTGTRVNITASEGNFSSYVILADSNGAYVSPTPIGTSDDLGWVSNAASREITVPSGKTFYVYSIVYGHQPKVTYISTVQNTVLTHVPEPQVNTSLDTTERDAIVAQISHSLDSSGNVKLTLSSTMADKSPDVALNGLHRFIFVNGNNFAMLSALGKSAAGVQLKADGVKVLTNKFYGTPADTITPASAPDTGIVIPLHFENLTGDSSYKILRKNVNDVPLTGALWVRAEASVGNDTQNAIAVKAQTLIEGSSIVAKQSTVAAIPTNPLLATDARLNNLNALDAPISSRLASSAYTTDVNVVKIKGINIAGTGTESDPWGPSS